MHTLCAKSVGREEPGRFASSQNPLFMLTAVRGDRQYPNADEWGWTEYDNHTTGKNAANVPVAEMNGTPFLTGPGRFLY